MSLKRVASENLAFCEAGSYVAPSGRTVDLRVAVERAVSGTVLYAPGELNVFTAPTGGATTRVEVTDESTGEAGYRLVVGEAVADVAALNFASARNPGGGFIKGAKSQEEDLARASALYPCLVTQWGYYEANREERSFAYTDHVIYSPQVPFFRDERWGLIEEPWLMSVVTAPAPNAGEARRHGESERVVRDALRRRAGLVLRVMASQGHRTAVLGAWGCGVFRNDPREVAEAFAEWLRGEMAGVFERVVFAVYERGGEGPNRRAFDEVFGGG
jgi:uncharacterized protein (TIGR02452 family)